MSKQAGTIADLLKQAAEESGADLLNSGSDIAAYIDESLKRLELAAGEAGFDRAVEAERDAVLLFSAGRSVDLADAADARIFSIVHAGLAVAISAVA